MLNARTIPIMCDEARPSVKNEYGDTEDFTVKVGDHKRSALRIESVFVFVGY